MSVRPKVGDDGAPAAQAAMTVADLAARIAALRMALEAEPAGLGPLLQAAGTGFVPGARLSPHAPTTLALLDELETLVGLLAEARAETATELRQHRRTRQALGAYQSRQPRR